MPRARTAALLIGLMAPGAAAAQAPAPPTIDCALGYEGLKAAAQWLPGVQWKQEGGYDIAVLSAPDAWTAQIAFTMPGHPAHPAVTLRTQRKQVTEVWTADSKGCGYGDQGQFAVLMADMKSGDTELTNASRHEVERRKEGRPPLAPAP
jgi:hypothetical protein